jgi:hypothetical protein
MNIFITITILIPLILFTIFEGNWVKRLFNWLFKDTTIPMTQEEALDNPSYAIVTALDGIPNIIWFVPLITLIIVIISLI